MTPAVEMGNTQLLLELLELGGSVSLLPDYVTRESYHAGIIHYLNGAYFAIKIWRQLIYHKNKWVSPSMRKVINYFRRYLKNCCERLAPGALMRYNIIRQRIRRNDGGRPFFCSSGHPTR